MLSVTVSYLSVIAREHDAAKRKGRYKKGHRSTVQVPRTSVLVDKNKHPNKTKKFLGRKKLVAMC